MAGLPVRIGYRPTTLVVIPIAFKGMGALAKVQAWVRSGPICSLGCSLDATCADVCRKQARGVVVILPMPTLRRV